MHEIGREQNQNTAMEFLILAIKILITEQKVNFLDTVCHICEKSNAGLCSIAKRRYSP